MTNRAPTTSKKWTTSTKIIVWTIGGLLVLVLINAGKHKQSREYDPRNTATSEMLPEVPMDPGDCTIPQRDAIQDLIADDGYACNTVGWCHQSEVDPNIFRVSCNHEQYQYRLEKTGGGWVTSFDE